MHYLAYMKDSAYMNYAAYMNCGRTRIPAKEGDLFMHILDMPLGGLTLLGWGRKAGAVRLLADKRPPNFINFIQLGTGVDIELTGITPDPAVTVVEVCVT